MKSNNYKIIAHLYESMINEASTALTALKDKPGARELIQYLHKNEKLQHDISYSKIPKISWSELKGSYLNKWVLMTFRQGAGAIKASNDTYYAISLNSETGEINHFENQRGGNVLQFFKQNLGSDPREIFVGAETAQHRKGIEKRKELQKQPGPSDFDAEKLTLKFKPIWIKASHAALADMNGWAMTLLKNKAFGKAREKIERMEKIESNLNSLERDPEASVQSFYQYATVEALYIAAAHYYPEETGEIRRSWRRLEPENYEGINHLLKDIGSGDTKKLATILNLFKDALLRKTH